MFTIPKIIAKYLMYFTIASLAIMLYSFFDEFYLPFLYLAYIQFALFFIELNTTKLDSIEIFGIFFILGLIICGSLSESSFRISTILYTFLFFTTFLCFRRGLKRNCIRINSFIKFLKYIIYAYAIVIIIQNIQVTANMQVFNAAIWQATTNAMIDGKLKLNSLALEASYVPLVLVSVFYTYISLTEAKGGNKYSIIDIWQKERFVFCLFISTIILTRSTTAIFILIIFLFKFINKKQLKIILPIMICLSAILTIIIIKLMPNIVDRSINLITNLINLDIKNIVKTDSSSSARIVPYFIYVNHFDIFSLNTWFGHGIDSLSKISTIYITGDESRSAGVGNILCLFYDYGLIIGILFIKFLKKVTFRKWCSYDFLLYLFAFSILVINHYVLWLYIILMYTKNIYCSKIYKLKRLSS